MKAARLALIAAVASIIGIAVISLLFPGCSFSIGGSPQKKQEISPLEVQRNVKNEMESEKTRQLIEDAAREQKLEILLQTPEANRLIQEKIAENFDTPEVNRQLQELMKKFLDMPEVQKKLAEEVKNALKSSEMKEDLKAAVQESLIKIIQGGGQSGGGGDQQSGGQDSSLSGSM